MRRRAGCALVALACAVLAGCSSSYTDGARPGVADAGGSGELSSPQHKVVVQLPLGPLTIEVGKPTQSTDTAGGDDRAADGAVWVPIAWTLAGGAADYDNSTPAFQFEVTLVADGRRYDLHAGQTGDSDEAASKYTPVVKQKSLDVVVQGDGKHLQADVEYDGLTQTADFDTGKVDAGVAAALYAKDAPHTALAQTACPVMTAQDGRRFRGSDTTGCTVGAIQTVPYVGGLGWVSSVRQSWTLVPFHLSLIEIDDRQSNARYSNFDLQRVDVTVDGAQPTTEILRYRYHDRLETTREGVLIFRTSSAPSSVEVGLTIRGQNEYRDSQFHTFTGDDTLHLH